MFPSAMCMLGQHVHVYAVAARVSFDERLWGNALEGVKGPTSSSEHPNWVSSGRDGARVSREG